VSVAVESRGANIRFGAAVYGSFLVASVVGVAFEAGQDVRAMTATAFGSMRVSWLGTGSRRSSARRSPPARRSDAATR
jgi:hypothetical protein